MAIFNLAGHNNNDSGAVANGRQENKETISLRDLINTYYRKGYKVINDSDADSLATMLKKLQPGKGSVCTEYHFDWAERTAAAGCSAFVDDDATELSRKMAAEKVAAISSILGTPNRGILSPRESHRGRLAMPRMTGTTCLIEVEFISNPAAMAVYDAKKALIANAMADIDMKYDDLIS